MTSVARWYCPPGMAKPTHCPWPDGIAMNLAPAAGPEGVAPGGRIWGGPMLAGEPGWHVHAQGWAFNLDGADPAHLLRLDPHPRIIDWRDVKGANPDQNWRVPVIFAPVRDDRGNVVQFISALERTWDGKQWDDPADLNSLRRRLHATALGIGLERFNLEDPQVVTMALDILRQGHDFDAAEIIAAGWVTQILVIRTLLVATGMSEPSA